jgi:hypothetical protein
VICHCYYQFCSCYWHCTVVDAATGTVEAAVFDTVTVLMLLLTLLTL